MGNDISEISETRTRSNPRELTENILNFPNLPDAGGEEEINPTIPNSPGDNIVVDNGAYKEDATLILNKLRIKNSERIIIGHLNINHIEKKSSP